MVHSVGHQLQPWSYFISLVIGVCIGKNLVDSMISAVISAFQLAMCNEATVLCIPSPRSTVVSCSQLSNWLYFCHIYHQMQTELFSVGWSCVEGAHSDRMHLLQLFQVVLTTQYLSTFCIYKMQIFLW
mmetsp:Transcript_23902/g.38917  ORF Transcript_23902/g.38917 Transcript_23902/m.38917 type:complete len:128 (+) Transcript_23902:62-445(+)